MWKRRFWTPSDEDAALEREMEREGLTVRVRGLQKEYRLGEIGGTTLQEELKRWWDTKRGEEEPLDWPLADGRKRGDRFLALGGIDLDVKAGESLGIIGKNGAGKSTLLKILCRVTAPSAGEAAIRGRIASMLEVGTGFHGEMTGRENVYMNGAILGMRKAEIDAKMKDIVEFSEVGDFIDTPVKRYSSGMFVKLAFSVAAHLDNEIMVMDEVLAVGDVEFQTKCLNKMREAARAQGRTVLYVSHNMNTIRRLCSRCVVLNEGRVIYDGNVDRAISLYMGMHGKLENRFVFTEASRPYGRFSSHLSIEYLTVEGGGQPAYPENGTAAFRIGFTASEALNNVRFRMELWYQDGTKVGSMLSNPLESVSAGRHEAELEIRLDGLTDGQFSADLVAYTVPEGNMEQILDGVYPGVVFEVLSGPGRDHHVEWSHQYWGHVRLPDMRAALRRD